MGLLEAMSAAPPTLRLYNQLTRLPGGRQLFSAGVALKAPYFRTILPSVQQLEPGRCIVTAPKWWGVQNHIGTFHAIAACNLAEAAMGMLAEATVPATHRWLPKGMNVEYLAKAQTALRAEAVLDPLPAFGPEGEEIPVPVRITDRDGTEVVRATITIWVTPKPS